MVIAAETLLAPHMLARPHVLILPIMVVWAAALVRCMDRHAPPPYWALPLLVLWANLHGSVVLALGLIGPAALEALLDTKRSEWPRVLLRWLPFTALAVAACCLTPYGPGPLLIPLTTLGAGDALNWISEWRPQDFGRFGAFEFLLLAGIFALSRGLTLPMVRTLVVLGLIHFALAQVRNADLLAMLAPLYLAAPLARQLSARVEDDAAGPARGVNLTAAGRDDRGDRAGAGARRAPGAEEHARGGRGQGGSRQGGTRAQRLFVRRLFDLRRHSHFH